MATDDVVLAQLQVTASAAEASAISARLALALYQGLTPELDIPIAPDAGPPMQDTTDCPHLQREDASVMNTEGETRDYCKSCRHYIFGDGRAEAAT